MREGDVLVITKLDRLARSTLHLHKIVNDLNERGGGFKVLDQSIDTTTKEGRLLFSILASLAEFETELRAERTNEGRIAAMERGVKFGAKPKLTEDQIAECAENIAAFMPPALKIIGDAVIQYNNDICNAWYEGICEY